MSKCINRLMRTDKEFRRIVNFVRAKYIMDGRKPPTSAAITRMIAKKIDKEDLLRDVFIKF